jgi:2-(1,2-epoxy-1,2-dihydrophenyl)acetyl-CoA isomerase
MHEQLELEAAVQHELAGSKDFAEGVAAFVERRTAVFGGR